MLTVKHILTYQHHTTGREIHTEFSTADDAEKARGLLYNILPDATYSAYIRRDVSIDGVNIEWGFMRLVEIAVKAGEKVAAIKAIREKTNLGLREAKDIVDAIHDKMKEGF